VLCEVEFWKGLPYACQSWYHPTESQVSGLLMNVADGV